MTEGCECAYTSEAEYLIGGILLYGVDVHAEETRCGVGDALDVLDAVAGHLAQNDDLRIYGARLVEVAMMSIRIKQ